MALHLYTSTSSQVPKVKAQPNSCDSDCRLNKCSYQGRCPPHRASNTVSTLIHRETKSCLDNREIYPKDGK